MVHYELWQLHIAEIKGKMERGELIPDPDWQRGYIWKLTDEQLLIDSILRGLPIPKFYLTQEYDPKKGAPIHYAVDGQQRLKAIYKFLTNKFPIKSCDKEYFFKDLDKATQEKITTYKLDGHYLVDYVQSDINFLFKRLNSTGIKLTNMEVWNSEFYGSGVLAMVREIDQKHGAFYRDIIYTEENIKRMLPLDDIIDLCNCLMQGGVKGGSKTELQSFLISRKDISEKESITLKSKFGKVIGNFQGVFSKQDLESSPYGKRTHFISLFLAIGLLIPEYYVLTNVAQLKTALLNFILNPSEDYKSSVLGAIRQEAKREVRVKILKSVILPQAKKLDSNRLFPESLKQKLWHGQPHVCRICAKPISQYKSATLDHIVPWAKGGETQESNAQLSHVRCNQKKKDKAAEFIID